MSGDDHHDDDDDDDDKLWWLAMGSPFITTSRIWKVDG